MARARLIITAVVFEGRTKSEVARDYGCPGIGSKNWCTGMNGKVRWRFSRGLGGRSPARTPWTRTPRHVLPAFWTFNALLALAAVVLIARTGAATLSRTQPKQTVTS